MKKNTFLAFIAFTSFLVQAQENTVKKNVSPSEFNKLTIEFTLGQSKGVRPYTEGYYSSNNHSFGTIAINSFNLGARYMISPLFGFKADFGHADLKSNSKTTSLPFKMGVYIVGIQGVINASRLFNIEKPIGKFGLLLHGGIQLSRLNSMSPDEMSKTIPNTVIRSHNYNHIDNNIGLIFGFSPQYRVSNKVSLISDVSIVNNFRQRFAWDGANSASNNNLSSQLASMSLGLTYSLGNNKMHGDWSIIKDKNQKVMDSLNNKISEIEALMNDTDKDGVPNYLDQENNSISGVAVDTKGKMIVDLNNNNISDELEKYIELKTKENNNSTNIDIAQRFINDGYVATYFDTGKVKPTNVSTQGIDFIRNYLKNNPTESISIIGHADGIGANVHNLKLSKDRAEAVKSVLIKLGIDASRLTAISSEEDKSVGVTSEEASKVFRRVTFKVKK